jgi:S-adenosylmethionine/arginine decarboxylase-like enzyme
MVEYMIFHKHMLVNAKVKNPIKTEQEAIDFLTDLVRRVDMKIIKGPFAKYLDVEGNRGLTAIVMIETSHIAFHIWDETDPGMLQFDLYTCGSLDKFTVLNALNERFDIKSIDWILFDRENGFVKEDSYSSDFWATQESFE